jgi:hypothetical protein
MQRIPLSSALPLTLAVSLALAGCGKRGDGVAATDTRKVDPFTQVEAHGALRLNITVDDSRAPSPVELSGDGNLLPLIETVVDGDTLRIRPTESVSFNLPLTATMTTKDLTRVDIHGAGQLTVTGLDNEAFGFEGHGASKAELSGKTKKLSLVLHGASKVDAESLTIEEASVEAHGASHVELDEPEKIEAELHGASRVVHDGDPEIDKSLHGGSAVEKR